MKAILSVIFMIIFSLGFSQTDNLTVGILLPMPDSKINESSMSKLETKLTVFLNKSNVFSYGYGNDFVLYPIVDILESELIQGGLENLSVTKVEISLIIKQLSSKKTYGSVSKSFKGVGKNEQQALANSFSKINPTDKVLRDFLVESKNNIRNYYIENCSKIIQNASNSAKTGDYEKAISLLQSIPDMDNNCFESAQETSITYYKLYQRKLCSSYITKAKSEIALNNFENATYYLNFIDNESDCYKDAESLINQISSKITKRESQAIDLETKRINAVKEIGKAYYSNLAKSSNYTVIIK